MGIFAFRGTHPIRAIHTADGGTGMPAATKRLRGLGMPEKPSRPNSLTAMEAQSDEPSASHEPARPMPQRKTHDAKPTLAELAGVRPTDKPDEGERTKRDRPRLAFRPFHALMAILTLSCALCASLTMPTDDPLQRTAAFAVADTLTGPTAAATGPANGTNAGTARKRAGAGRVHTGQP